jgi:hypothetical protein
MTSRTQWSLALSAPFVLLVAAACLSPLNAADQKKADAKKADPARPPELKVLDRWVGRWDMQLTTKPGPWLPEGVKGTFTATIAWDLNDRFVRCDAKGQSVRGERKVDDAFLWICTWSPQRQEYRSWVFWSAAGAEDAPAGVWDGNPVASATWDEATRTMTTKMEDKESGITSVGVTRWTDDDHHEFTNTVKDANGEVLMEQSGKASRRK